MSAYAHQRTASGCAASPSSRRRTATTGAALRGRRSCSGFLRMSLCRRAARPSVWQTSADLARRRRSPPTTMTIPCAMRRRWRRKRAGCSCRTRRSAVTRSGRSGSCRATRHLPMRRWSSTLRCRRISFCRQASGHCRGRSRGTLPRTMERSVPSSPSSSRTAPTASIGRRRRTTGNRTS